MDDKNTTTAAKPGWEAFIDYADEVNVLMYGLPPGIDFSRENLNANGQTPVCYAAFVSKKGIARAIAERHQFGEEVDVFGFSAVDYMNAANPLEMIRSSANAADQLKILVVSTTEDEESIGVARGKPSGL